MLIVLSIFIFSFIVTFSKDIYEYLFNIDRLKFELFNQK